MSATGPRRLLLAYAAGGFGLAVNAMILFLIPLRAAELGIGVGVIGVLLATKAITEALCSVPLGGLMDRFGSRAAYIAGTGLSVLVALGLFLATAAPVLFLLQVGLGLARPLAWVGGQSYVSGLRSGADRAYDTGKFSFAANLSQIAAPLVVGTVVQGFSVRHGFLVLMVHAAGFFILGLTLPRTGSRPAAAHPSSRPGSVGGAVQLLRRPGIQVAMLLTFVRLWVPACWTAFLPLHLVQSGFPAGLAGSVVSMMAATATVTSALTGRIAKLGRPEMVTASGLACSSAGLAAAPFLVGVPFIYVSSILVGIGQGLSLPMLIVLVSQRVPSEDRGLALGLRASVNQVAAGIAPVVVASLIGAFGIRAGFPAAAVISGSVLGLATGLDRARVRRGAG